MSSKDIPETDGITLREAYKRFVDPEKFEALQAASAAPGVGKRIVIYGSQDAYEKKRAQYAYWETIKAFRILFISGDLVAVASEGTPTEPQRRIPAHAWPYLTPNFANDTLRGPDKRTFYGVRIFSKEQIANGEHQPTSQTSDDKSDEVREPFAGVDTEKSPKIPIKTQVGEIWASMPEDAKRLVEERGGKTRLAKCISSQLPERNADSVERIFRDVLKDERDGKSGKKAE